MRLSLLIDAFELESGDVEVGSRLELIGNSPVCEDKEAGHVGTCFYPFLLERVTLL